MHKGFTYLEEDKQFFAPNVHLSTDTLHFALCRQLEDLEAEGITSSAVVLHGDIVQSLANKTNRSLNEKEMFRKLSTHKLIFMPNIADHHISLSVLHRSLEDDTIFIMDSLNSPAGRNKKIIQASSNLLRIGGIYSVERLKVAKLKTASQGLNLDDCGVFAAAFLDRFIRTHFSLTTTQTLKNVTQDEVEQLRQKLLADFVSKSLLSVPPVSIDLESPPELKRKKKKANISSDSDEEKVEKPAKPADRKDSQGDHSSRQKNLPKPVALKPLSTRKKAKPEVVSESAVESEQPMKAPDEEAHSSQRLQRVGPVIIKPHSSLQQNKPKDDSESEGEDETEGSDETDDEPDGGLKARNAKRIKRIKRDQAYQAKSSIIPPEILAAYKLRKGVLQPVPQLGFQTSLADLKNITAVDVAKDAVGEFDT